MAIRASNIVLIYFVIGAVMFGGGAVTWDNSGPSQFFIDIDSEGDVSPADEPGDQLTGVSSVITNLVGAFGGPAILVWNLFVGLIGYIHWPVIVLLENQAPPRVTVLLGGTLQVAFYMATIRMVRTSA